MDTPPDFWRDDALLSPAQMRAASPNLDHPFPKKAALIANWELLAELGVID